MERTKSIFYLYAKFRKKRINYDSYTKTKRDFEKEKRERIYIEVVRANQTKSEKENKLHKENNE